MPLAYGLTEPVDLALSGLPQALDGLRIAHLTDLHVHRQTRRLDRLINQLAKVRIDLGVLTGDYGLKHRPKAPAIDFLKRLTAAVKPSMGWVGIFGNHDTADLIEQAQDLPITWLENRAVALPQAPIDILGLTERAGNIRPDGVVAALSAAELSAGLSAAPLAASRQPRLRLALAHRPDDLALCADLGADFVLAGHTHGGQVRLPMGFALFNSSDLPLHLSCGLMRHRDTICAVARGVGSTDLMQLPIFPRIFCPPHVPIYTLHPGPTPGEPTDSIQCIQRW